MKVEIDKKYIANPVRTTSVRDNVIKLSEKEAACGKKLRQWTSLKSKYCETFMKHRSSHHKHHIHQSTHAAPTQKKSYH